MIWKIFGAIGLILITWGVLIKDKKKESIVFILGGLALESYSISIKDPIFITLQAIFVIVAMYELIKVYKEKK